MATPSDKRIYSIDVFRGLTIFVMIFVNDLASVKNLPGWLYHAAADADAMTFVDVVFPAFLFIVGMAIPFAIQKRESRGDSIGAIWKHALIRTAGLLVLGFYMVNIGGINAELTGLTKHWWKLLMFLSAILVWNHYAKTELSSKSIWILRGIGIVGLAVLAIIYRTGEPGLVRWMHPQWWGILGLIGWAYIASLLAYFFAKKRITGIIITFAFFIALFIGEKTGALDFLTPLTNYVKLGSQVGAHAALTTGGIILGVILQNNRESSQPYALLRKMVIYGLLLVLFGYLIRPLYGISKIYATPGWVLYSAAICVGVFMVLYWIIDMKGYVKWAGFLAPAGKNPLLAYILPSIVSGILGILGITLLSDHLGSGGLGVIRSIIFSLLMLWITSVLSRWKIQLHL